MNVRFVGGRDFVHFAITVVFTLFVVGILFRAATRWVPATAKPIRYVASRADLGGV
jgi:hypothetical protein